MSVRDANLPWRTGRKVGRTLYAVVGDEPSDLDRPIGMLDTPALATEAVRAHNERLARALAAANGKGSPGAS